MAECCLSCDAFDYPSSLNNVEEAKEFKQPLKLGNVETFLKSDLTVNRFTISIST